MRMLHHGRLAATASLAWFFRVAPAKAGAPILAVCGSLLFSHTPEPPKRRETKRTAAHRLAPEKPAADLLIAARAYANQAEAGGRTAVRVAAELGTWRKDLLVLGDRHWQPAAYGSQASPPQPFDSIAIDYAHAYGGENFPWNPIGKGAGPGARGQLLPNVEFPNRRIETRASETPPAGFGPLDPEWRPRADKRGTHDDAWLAEYWPGRPADFDPAYWNEAPADQQFPAFFRGDERLVLTNMHATHKRLEIALPAQTVRAFAATPDQKFAEITMRLDTIDIDVEAAQTELIWRGSLAVRSARLRDIAFLFTLTEPLAAKTPLEDCRTLFEAARREKYPNQEEQEEAAQAASTAREAGAAARQAAFEQEIAAAAAAATAQETAQRARAAEALKPRPGAKPPAPPPEGKSALDILRKRDPAKAAEMDAALTAATQDAATPPGGRPADPWTRARVIEAHAAGQDMAGAGLSSLDLGKLDLTGAKLAGANLTGANLAETWLQSSDLRDADLTGANARETLFATANLAGARFKNADLKAANFADADLTGVSFAGLSLPEISFDRAHGERADFAGADLTGASFRAARLPAANFAKAALAGATFDDAELPKASFFEAGAENASFLHATLTNIRASAANFAGARFAGATAVKSVWQQAKLDHADFSRAVLTRANFAESSAVHANFDRSSAQDAKFDEANLAFARLTNAKLVSASFQRADLRDADISGANLYQAGLFGAHAARLKRENTFLAGTMMAP